MMSFVRRSADDQPPVCVALWQAVNCLIAREHGSIIGEEVCLYQTSDDKLDRATVVLNIDGFDCELTVKG